MLLQILCSIRSERQSMEQTQGNLLFRWFLGRSMNDTDLGARGLNKQPRAPD
jgi:transposase